MSNVKKDVQNIVQSAKQIGDSYRDAGRAVGNAYKKAGQQTARLFKNIYNDEENPADEQLRDELVLSELFVCRVLFRRTLQTNSSERTNSSPTKKRPVCLTNQAYRPLFMHLHLNRWLHAAAILLPPACHQSIYRNL